MPFSKKKFQGLSTQQQHKKCSELLRKLYLAEYNQMQCWMDGEPLHNPTAEQLSNRYHEHLDLAKVCLKEHRLLPRIDQGDRCAPVAEKLPVDIYLDQIRSAHNVGSILRTVEAFSLGSVIFSPKTPYVDSPQVQKTSMGAHRYVECRQGTLVTRPLIALETSPDATPIEAFAFPDHFTLAIGNEEYGCSEEILSSADHLVAIPLWGRKNSLNVANAFAIAAAEISRQKRS